MSLIRYLFISTVVFISCNNLNASIEPSMAVNNTLNKSSSETNKENWQERRGEIQKRQSFISQLNLTTEQKQQIVKIRDSYQERIDVSRKNLKISQQELQQMLEGNSSASEIKEKHQAVIRYRQEFSDIMLDRTLEVREILTEEQRSKFIEIVRSQK